MIHFAYRKPSLLLFAVATIGTAVWTRAHWDIDRFFNFGRMEEIDPTARSLSVCGRTKVSKPQE